MGTKLLHIIFISILFFMLLTCKKYEKNFYGNWSWISSADNKYYEVLIDSNTFIGYRHSFLYPRKFKIMKDTLYIDEVEKDIFDLKYKIRIVNKNRILLLSQEYPSVELNRLKETSYTIDSIKTEADEEKFELEFSSREEKWKLNNNRNPL